MAKNCVLRLLAKLKNGQSAKKSIIFEKKTKMNEKFLKLLWDRGYILGYIEFEKNRVKNFKIYLKYDRSGIPAINKIKAVSKPGARVYCNLQQMWKLQDEFSLILFLTSKGLKASFECKRLSIGGELLAVVF